MAEYPFPTEKDLKAVDLSWSRYLLPPIHPEGGKILGVLFLGVLLIGLFASYIWYLGLPLLVFTFYFFRNPPRVTPPGDNLIIAPADGIVSNIKPVVPAKELGLGDKPLTRVSIFMSVFSVHVNRAPVSGSVAALRYRPGKFVSVADKDSEDNERMEIVIETPKRIKIGFAQIAGLVARRIYCPLHKGDKLRAGQVFGMIRFGSRLDVYLPRGVHPSVRLGQISVAGETILADMSVKPTPKGRTKQ
ncbi:MAG: phosphatidylserine decarboxylase [Alphaproteobacteria bacterium]|nr:phosphatidylserine decarboxylase [Alphaproteobacteria bacterium]